MARIIAFALLALLPIANAEVATGNVTEILPQAARQHQQQGAILVDVREDDERAQGMAEGGRIASLPVRVSARSASPNLADLPQRAALRTSRRAVGAARVYAGLFSARWHLALARRRIADGAPGAVIRYFLP